MWSSTTPTASVNGPELVARTFSHPGSNPNLSRLGRAARLLVHHWGDLSETSRSKPSAAIRVVPWKGTDAELVALAGPGGPKFAAAVYDRFGPDINRLVRHLLGRDDDLDDLVHDCFMAVMRGMARVRDPSALQGWMASVTVNTVRSHLRKRRVRRLWSTTGEALTEVAARGVDHEARQLLAATYAVLDKLGTDERLAFVLRHVEQRPLAEVAELCGCSLATIKRRLSRADQRFARHAAKHPILAERLAASPKRSKHVAV